MAQQQQSSGGSSNSDNSLAPLWFSIILFIALYFFWRFAKKYIVMTVFQMNIWQANFVSLFVNSTTLNNDIYLMQTLDPASVDWNTLVDLTARVGFFTRYPVVLSLVILAIWLYQSNIKLKFHKAHSMKSLREQEQANWSSIAPAVHANISADTDINKGPWAMALSPYEFAKKHNLLKKSDQIVDKTRPGIEFTAGIRHADAKRVFTLQLGDYWEGFNTCAPHVVALAAVFMARIYRDRPSAQLILETLDRTAAKGKPDYSKAWPVLKKYYKKEDIQEIISQHGYLLTVMASLLEGARKDGVVPAAEFLWLKPIDRRLWYMLNSVGRQTPFVEVGGPFAHWLAEKKIGRRCLMPMIDEAIKGLELAIQDVRLKPRVLAELLP